MGASLRKGVTWECCAASYAIPGLNSRSAKPCEDFVAGSVGPAVLAGFNLQSCRLASRKAESNRSPWSIHAASNIPFTSTEKPGRLGESACSPGRNTLCSSYSPSDRVSTVTVSATGLTVQYSGMPASPVLNLIRVHVVLLGQLREGLLAPKRGHRHLRLERRRMIPALASHLLLLSLTAMIRAEDTYSIAIPVQPMGSTSV